MTLEPRTISTRTTLVARAAIVALLSSISLVACDSTALKPPTQHTFTLGNYTADIEAAGSLEASSLGREAVLIMRLAASRCALPDSQSRVVIAIGANGHVLESTTPDAADAPEASACVASFLQTRTFAVNGTPALLAIRIASKP